MAPKNIDRRNTQWARCFSTRLTHPSLKAIIHLSAVNPSTTTPNSHSLPSHLNHLLDNENDNVH